MRVRWVLGVLGAGAAVGMVACFPAPVGEDTDASEGQVVAEKSTTSLLKSTLSLESGCTAVKVGPRHLLTAARCVADKAAYTSGKTINFKALEASTEKKDGGADTEKKDSGTDTEKKDSGTDTEKKDSGTDAENAAPKVNTSTTSAVIKDVKTHETYSSKCTGNVTCEFGVTVAAAVKDVALIILDADLVNVPSVPIDLDSVSEGTKLLSVESGCATFEGTAGATATAKAVAVPRDSVKSHGSYANADGETVVKLGVNYVITRGSGWSTATEGKLCKKDIGAPLFRGDAAAVVGVTANFTARADKKGVPVTIEHTRLSSPGMSTWLADFPGVELAHGCAEDGMCPKTTYDGPSADAVANDTMTAKDAGDDPKKDDADEDDDKDETATPTELPERGEDQGIPETEADYTQKDNEATVDAGKAKKKKKKAEAGCSAAPGTSSTGDGALVGFGLAIAMVAARRRRTNNA